MRCCASSKNFSVDGRKIKDTTQMYLNRSRFVSNPKRNMEKYGFRNPEKEPHLLKTRILNAVSYERDNIEEAFTTLKLQRKTETKSLLGPMNFQKKFKKRTLSILIEYFQTILHKTPEFCTTCRAFQLVAEIVCRLRSPVKLRLKSRPPYLLSKLFSKGFTFQKSPFSYHSKSRKRTTMFHLVNFVIPQDDRPNKIKCEGHVFTPSEARCD
ncbi:hypothetical protein NPIL_466041 [Nephila pilipes]|uniref:Uncharacterized protein n=1 Tax=Nephila pilipes TaxID=299642 RepID=A0A8X6PQG4_NEPPI|nr:hypothetical protein NPIL_466041 [Nephila pilipes]